MIISHTPGNDVHVFDDATVVCGASMVFSRTLEKGMLPGPFDPTVELCEEEVCRRLRRVQVGDRITFEFTQPPEILAHFARDVLPFNLLHASNYFHFLIEWLPSLAAAIAEGRVDKGTMIVSGLLHPNMWHALLLLTSYYKLPVLQLRSMQGVSGDHVIQLRPSHHARELINRRVSDTTYNHHNLTLLRGAFAPLWSRGRNRKLYVRRASGYRNVVNAVEVEELALAAGYEIVDPGNLGFTDQVAMFSEATHIVGASGAWGANLVFARDGARVTIFNPCTVQSSTSFWRPLGAILNLEVSEIYCPVPKVLDEHPIHSDFIIPVDRLREALQG